MTDFRALCVELTDCLEKSDWPHQYKSVFEQWIYIAHAALAESEPEGPTDAELLHIAAAAIDGYGNGINPGDYEQATECAIEVYGSELCAFARAVLARWGNHVLQPIPVSERPKPEDCNDDGYVWAWRRFDLERGIDNDDFWCLAFHDRLENEDCGYTHWLPAHALPLPTHE